MNKPGYQYTMKVFVIISLMLFTIGTKGQSGDYYMVFSTSGSVYHSINKQKSPVQRGDKFIKNNLLVVDEGIINLLDNNCKRVTISKKGVYSFQDVRLLFDKANSSLTNKYLTLVWEKMNESHEIVQHKAGVERGYVNDFFPSDSSVILSDTLWLRFDNPGRQTHNLEIIDDSAKLVYSEVTDSNQVIIIKSVCPWWSAGYYTWIIKSPGQREKDIFHFYIPDETERNKYKNEWNEILMLVKTLPESERNNILKELQDKYKWVW